MEETEKTLDSLPLDILRDIFLRLPVESLARLACLSNFFGEFITNDHDLVYSHFKRATPVVQVVNYSQEMASKSERGNYETVLLKFKNMNFSNPFYIGETFVLAGSCNGLICFYQRSQESLEKYNRRNIWEHPLLNQISQETTEDNNRIYIWNPALHQIRALPKLIGDNDFIAFGYDPNSQDYKILRICGGKRNKAEVYSWKNKSWKLIRKNFRYVPEDFTEKSIVDFEGSLYWISGIIKYNVRVVSAFNIADERLDLYRVPTNVPKISKGCNMLGVFKGCLSLLARAQYSEAWEIWSMEKYGTDRSWTKTYQFLVRLGDDHIELYEHVFLHVFLEHNGYPCGLTTSGKIIIASRGGEYVLIDPETISWETLRLEENPSRKLKLLFIDYVESLSSVHPQVI